MRLKLIATTVTMLLAIFGSNSVCSQTLVVWQKDGSKVYYSLDEQPKTTFTIDDLVITTNSTTINYPLSKIQRYTYEGGALGISNVSSDGIFISHRGDEIIVTGLPDGKSVTVYGVDGKALLLSHSDGSSCLSLSLSKLPTGVYVVKAETINYKFIKR